jgi:ATP-dependent DNA ligase
LEVKAKQFVLDGEIIVSAKRTPEFDALLQRIHPAASRIKKLANETPATLIVFVICWSTARAKILRERLWTAAAKSLNNSPKSI